MPAILQMQNIVKEFSGVRALNGISFEVQQGEVHALCGENGAGKSTLMKVLSGVHPYGTYTGNLFFNNTECKFKTIAESEHHGIAIIAQELALVPEMTVAENIFLGREKTKNGIIRWNDINNKAAEILNYLQIKIDVKSRIKNLPVGQQQMIEIAKALSKNATLLIFDEPTSALSEKESAHLLKIIGELKNKNITSIIVSHKLNEVLAVADNITVLRDGASVGNLTKAEATSEKIISLMVGRELKELFNKQPLQKVDAILATENLCAWNDSGQQILHNISIEICKGEVVGLAGLMGAGRTELFRALFGAWNGKTAGTIRVKNNAAEIRKPADAMKASIALITEDRKKTGLLPEENIVTNSTLASLKKFLRNFLLQKQMQKEKVSEYATLLNIKTHSVIHQELKNLSGGNQQKVVLAKWLLTKPELFLMDEPTRGIDIGAKAEIYSLIASLASEGAAFLIASGELQELLGICDRIYVMDKGQIKTCLQRNEATQEKIMHFATGIN